MTQESYRVYRYRQGWYAFVGRIFVAVLFVIAGWSKLIDFAGAEQLIAAAGFAWPTLLTVVAIIVELGGGLMLLTGFHARLAAWLLILFTVVATIAYPNLGANQEMSLTILKNLAIIGGLFYVIAQGAGRFALTRYNKKTCALGALCPDCGSDDPDDQHLLPMGHDHHDATIVEELEEAGYLPSTISLPTSA